MLRVPSRPAFRPGPAVAAVLTSSAFVIAACAAGPAAPRAANPTAEPRSAAAAAQSAAAPIAEPTAMPAMTQAPAPTTPAGVVLLTPSPAPEAYESPLYAYVLQRPSEVGVTGFVPATERWDGRSTIGSTDPMVDQFPRTGQRLAFVLAAPTDLDLAAWTADVHKRAVRDHGCPEQVGLTMDVVIHGAPGRLVAFTCQGLVVLETTSVRSGMGLIAKQIMPPPADGVLDEAFARDFVMFLGNLLWG